MGVWIEATGEPLCLQWAILPGLELVVSRLCGKINVGHMLGPTRTKSCSAPARTIGNAAASCFTSPSPGAKHEVAPVPQLSSL